MITELRLGNFKAFREAVVPLERLTVFVGPNGSGKTSIVEALSCLAELSSNGPRQVFRGAKSLYYLLRRQHSGDFDLAWVIAAEQCEQSFEITIQTSELVFPFEALRGTVRARRPNGEEQTINLDEVDDFPPWPRRLVAPEPLRAVILRLDPEVMARASISHKPDDGIGGDGSGLAGALAEMAATRPEDFQFLQAQIRTVLPDVRSVRLQRSQYTENRWVPVESAKDAQLYAHTEESQWGYEMVLDMACGDDIPACAASEGTLLVIGLLAILVQSKRPALILLENIEHGLHPRALAELVGLLRRLLERYPETQIVATSHSPYLLDHFHPSEIRLTYAEPETGSVCVPLGEHPEFEKWKDIMSPGEFWSTVGEKWAKDTAETKHG